MTSLEMTSHTTSYSRANPKRRFEHVTWGIVVIGGIYFGAILLTVIKENIYQNQNGLEINSDFGDEINNVKAEIRRFKRQSPTETTVNYSMTTGYDELTPNGTEKSQGIYPVDLFDLESRRKGAVVLHAFGMLYMFIALAIVCDEFFVPALEVIINHLSISDDVAGATFMAAGGSAPELFTSIIGVFLAKSNVGVGTIVGSAVFNILFVIGMCSLFSHEVLRLTWWPLFRDCLFYIISLLILIFSFRDSKIEYYECIVLILVYLCYVTFMKFNRPIEAFIKAKLFSVMPSKTSQAVTKVAPSENTDASPSVKAIMDSISDPNDPGHPHNTFSYGIVQLIMHSLDPATDAPSAEKSSRLYAIARMKLISPRVARSLSARRSSPHRVHQRNDPHSQSERVKRPTTPTAVIYENEAVKVVPQNSQIDDLNPVNANVKPQNPIVTSYNGVALTTIDEESENHPHVDHRGFATSPSTDQKQRGNTGKTRNGEMFPQKDETSSEHEMGDALDMSWPKSNSKRCVYILLFPIMFLLWITLPDVRIQKKEKWFMCSFFGSITWIAVFSYLMVWWAHQIGETIGISEAVMGLTFLAAGTSVPDLITSVIVARKGLGDMAVSSSVGSNIFDVTIGLPFPWLIKSITTLGKPVIVESEGLFCSVLLLFLMLLFVVISIAVCRWKMSKKLGLAMLALYAVFLVFSLLLEFTIISCPIKTT